MSALDSIDSEGQLSAWVPPYRPSDIIEDGLLAPESVLMLFGSAGSWKTMNAMHLAYCLAQGKPWFGLETRKCNIFYHQEELPKYRFQERFLKYRINNYASSKSVYFQTPVDPVVLDTTYGLQQMEKNIAEVKRRAPDPDLPIVIIIDPLYIYLAGHISDEYEVKKFLTNANQLKRAYGLAWVVIHHARLTRVDASGKVVDLDAEEIMGSSYWNNWLDTIVRVKLKNPYTGANTVAVNFGKHRNAQHFHPGFTVRWERSNLVPEVVEREIIEEEDPTVRDLI